MDYFILFFGLTATLVALFGETRKNNKLSVWGYVALIIAVISFIFSCIKSYQDSVAKIEEKNSFEIESKKKDTYLETIKSQTKTANDSIKSLQQELRYSKQEVINLKDKVEEYKELLNKVSKESERQPQWTMLDYFYLKPNQSVELPISISSGSILRFVGKSKSKLIVKYGSQTIEIPELDYRFPPEIPVIGHSGWTGMCTVKNVGNEDNGFKIYVLSTPRSRSSLRSWTE